MSILAAIGWKIVPRIGISPHGIGIALGYVAGTALLARRAERLYGVKREHVTNFMTWAVLGVIVGARLFYVAGHWNQVVGRHGLVEIVKIQNGGIVLYGGIFGAIIAAYPYIRKHGLPLVPLLDGAAPGIVLGIVIGRIGDLMIGDHLGGPTSFFLGYRYLGSTSAEGPPGCPVSGGGFDPFSGVYCPRVGEVVHQTALYDFLSVIVLFPVLMLLARRRRPNGWLITFAAAWYATGRFLIDFARTQTPTYAGLRGTQWVSVALLLGAAVYLVRARRAPVAAHPAAGPAPLAWVDEEEAAEQMVAEGSPVPAWRPEERARDPRGQGPPEPPGGRQGRPGGL